MLDAGWLEEAWMGPGCGLDAARMLDGPAFRAGSTERRDGQNCLSGKPGEPSGPLVRGTSVTAADVGCDVQQGAPVTWTDIYLAERDGLVRLAYLITGSQAVAEDLVQDCFIRVMPRLEPTDQPGAYLRRSVVNACYSWHRRNRREVQRGVDELRSPYEDSHDVEMWDALTQLAPRRRTVVVLRYYLDMSEAEVASALGCRVGTVKSTTHRALKDLRRMFEK
jgi:RNA polymerase sigma-70 factor (sigma-E family)